MGLEKKGQLTIFVIIAVVIVVAIILFLYLEGPLGGENYDPEVVVMRDNLLDCLRINNEQSLGFLGIQGGYFNVPEPSEFVEPINTIGFFSFMFSYFRPYYYYEEELYLPTLDKMIGEVEKAAKASSFICFEALKESEDFQSVEFSEVAVDTSLENNEMKFTYNVVLTVAYDNKTVRVDLAKTPVVVPTRLEEMRDMGVFIAEAYKENNEWTPYSEIAQRARRDNLYVSVVDSADGSGNTVTIQNVDEGFYPQSYIFNNKFSHADLTDIEVLL